jgi:hypothetical protein
MMAEITEEQHYNTLSIVRNLEQKNTLHLAGKRINTTHHCYRGLRKGFMNMTIISTFIQKHGFVFLPKKKKISIRAS